MGRNGESRLGVESYGRYGLSRLKPRISENHENENHFPEDRGDGWLMPSVLGGGVRDRDGHVQC